MNYKTKFNVGDIVWIMNNNKAVFGIVWRVVFTKDEACSEGVELVHFETGGNYTAEPATNLFHTKEDLIESL